MINVKGKNGKKTQKMLSQGSTTKVGWMGAWVVKLVERLTLGFGSSSDLSIRR